MGTRTRYLTILVLLVVGTACATSGDETGTSVGDDSPTTSQLEATPTTGQLEATTTVGDSPDTEYVMAFVRGDPESENTDIYLIDSDGQETRLTDNEAFDESPAFSPDGTQLTFDSNRTGDWETFVVNVDGSGLRQLTESPGQDGFTSWSPHGDAVVMDSERDGDFEIYILDLATSEVSQLTDNDAWDGEPAWSPDGETIVFHSNRDGDGLFDLYSSDPTGSSQEQLVENGFDPAWSPDGTRLVFAREPDDGSDRDLWILHLESGALDLLVGGDTWDDDPVWSADGTRIYFGSDRTDPFGIFSVASDGSDIRLEVEGEDVVFQPAVRP